MDSDEDDLPDWWEMKYFGNLDEDAQDDSESPDGDGLINLYEYLLGFDPTLFDSDGNGVADLLDAITYPDVYTPAEWLVDTDGDGLLDGVELFYGLNPNAADSNGDGIDDRFSLFAGIDPASMDSDGDGISNAAEIAQGTDPLRKDTDNDGVDDDVDAFPLDPTRWALPSTDPNDVTAPQIWIDEPADAQPL